MQTYLGVMVAILCTVGTILVTFVTVALVAEFVKDWRREKTRE